MLRANLPGAVFANIDWHQHIGTPSDLLSTARLGNWLAVGAELSNRRAISEQTDSLVGAMRQHSVQQIEQSQQDARIIAAAVRQAGADMDQGLRDLGALLDDRLSLVIDQLQVANALARDTIALLRLPDSQKERRHHIEQGLRHYTNARLDDGLFEFSLNHFLKAESFDQSDHRVLLRIGLILLYSPGLCDLPRAELYLMRAARFAMIETMDGAAISLDPLDAEQAAPTPQTAKQHAAVICKQLSIVCLAQKKWPQSLQWAEKSLALDENSGSARQQFVRALAANDDPRLYAQTRLLLEKDANAAWALAESVELLSAEAVQLALADYRSALETGALEDVERLIEVFSSIPVGLHVLAGEAAGTVIQLIDAYRKAPGPERAALALQIVRRLNDPVPGIGLNEQALVIELKCKGKISDVFIGSARTVVVSESPDSPRNKDGFATDHDIVAIDPLGLAVKRQWRVSGAGWQVLQLMNGELGFLTHNPPQYWVLDGKDEQPLPLPLKVLQASSDGSFMELDGRLAVFEDADNKGHFRVLDAVSGEVLASTRLPGERDCVNQGTRHGVVPLLEFSWTKGFKELVTRLHFWDVGLNQMYENPSAVNCDSIVISPDRSRALIESSGGLTLQEFASRKRSKPALAQGQLALPGFDQKAQVITVASNSCVGQAVIARGETAGCSVSPDARWVVIWQDKSAVLMPLPGPSGLLRVLQIAHTAQGFRGRFIEETAPKQPKQQQPASSAQPANISPSTPQPSADHEADDTQSLASLADARRAEALKEFEAIPVKAREARDRARAIEWQEDKKLFRRKDYSAALSEYQLARSLGYPGLDTVILLMQKKVRE